MRKQITRTNHQPLVGLAPQDSQPSTGTRSSVETRKNPVSGKKEIPTEHAWQHGGTQPFRLHQGDGQKAIFAVRIQYQAWRKERPKEVARKRVCQDETVSEKSGDVERMTF